MAQNSKLSKEAGQLKPYVPQTSDQIGQHKPHDQPAEGRGNTTRAINNYEPHPIEPVINPNPKR